MSLPQYITTTTTADASSAAVAEAEESKWDQWGREYYDVTADQVSTRLQLACAVEGTLLDGIIGTTNKPDFYGPVWIGATSAVAIFTGATIAHSFKTGRIVGDYPTILSALLTIYGYVVGEAVGVWTICRYAFGLTGEEVAPGLLVTLVGYSLALLPAAALLASVPWWLVQTASLLCCGILSCLFIYRNVAHVLSRQPGMREEQRSVLVAVWMICHASLFAVIRLRYY